MDQATIDKVKRLATDDAATNGERAAATEALRRANVPLDLEPAVITIPSLEEIEAALGVDPDSQILIPLTMVTPTSQCIYAPSRIIKPILISTKEVDKLGQSTLLVSFASDGKSNPQRIKIYNGQNNNFGRWFLLDEQGLKVLESMISNYALVLSDDSTN